MNFVRNLIWFATLVAPAVLASLVRWVAAVALAFGFLVVRFLVWAKVVAGERIIAANSISVSRFKVFSSSPPLLPSEPKSDTYPTSSIGWSTSARVRAILLLE